MADNYQTGQGSQKSVKTNVQGDVYLWTFAFESNSTAAPDGLTEGYGITMARADVGDYTATFASHLKPDAVLGGWVNVAENNATVWAKVGTYTPGTGVLTLFTYTQDATSGICASADTNNLTYQVVLVCVNSNFAP